MATPAQINANRLNARKSTGPRSDEGKAASRFNALQHGIDARSLVIPGEDPAELDALALDYHRQFHPDGPLENYLVETLIHADWTRRRYTRVQAQLLNLLLKAQQAAPAASESPLATVLQDDARGPNLLDKVRRQLVSSERSYFRALNALRRAQRERQAEQQSREDQEIEALLSCAPPFPPAPVGRAAQFGFVPPPAPRTVPSRDRQGAVC